MNISRRNLLGAVIAPVPLLAVAPEARARPVDLYTRARAELERCGSHIRHTDVVGVADYSAESRRPRFHLIDMAKGSVTTLLVAHGRGSDPQHTGRLQRFSNDPGSAASSSGAYVTGDHYAGKHGRSMRLKGLDPTNNHAEARAIVVHGAWYVSPAIIRQHGVLGRSEGCFAFAETDLAQVLERLGPGRLLVADRF